MNADESVARRVARGTWRGPQAQSHAKQAWVPRTATGAVRQDPAVDR